MCVRHESSVFLSASYASYMYVQNVVLCARQLTHPYTAYVFLLFSKASRQVLQSSKPTKCSKYSGANRAWRSVQPDPDYDRTWLNV